MISKLPDVGTTIFTVMSQLAVEHNAINLGQGFPDFPMSRDLTDLVNKAMQDGHNQYVHMNGLPLLTQRIATKIEKLYQTTIDSAAQITVTPGGTYAIYTALTTILHAGDEVIVFGKELSVNLLATWSKTIPYEILTSVSQRVKRIYFEE